jgi:hypothetical protein
MRLGLLLAVLVVSIASSALASPIASATTITEVIVRYDGMVLVRFASNNPSPASCASNNTEYKTWYGFNSSTDGGRSLLSAVMAAKLAGKQVTMWSDSVSCTAWPQTGSSGNGVEDLFLVRVQ